MADVTYAALDGFDLEIETLEDSFEKAIARYEYPFVDGADLDDLGLKAHTIRIRCWFWDDGADHATYDSHIDLLNHLKDRSFSTLTHPLYGRMQGCITTVSVRHDDKVRCAEVDIAFTEQGVADLGFNAASDDISGAEEESFTDVQTDLETLLEEDVTAALSTAEASTLMSRVLTEGQDLYSQFTDMSRGAQAWVLDMDNILTRFQAVAVEVNQPTNSLISTISFAANLPGRVIGTITLAVERVARLYDSAIDFPARFIDSCYYSLQLLGETLELFAETPAAPACLSQYRVISARQLCLEAGYCYQADETRRSSQRRQEQQPSFDVLGRSRSPVPGPQLLTINELEQTLSQVRTAVQSAVVADREQAGLKGMAAGLLEHVNTIKIERERIISVTVPDALPLHLVCLQQGLSYRYADRIMSINAIPNPNRTTGQVQVYRR